MTEFCLTLLGLFSSRSFVILERIAILWTLTALVPRFGIMYKLSLNLPLPAEVVVNAEEGDDFGHNKSKAYESPQRAVSSVSLQITKWKRNEDENGSESAKSDGNGGDERKQLRVRSTSLPPSFYSASSKIGLTMARTSLQSDASSSHHTSQREERTNNQNSGPSLTEFFAREQRQRQEGRASSPLVNEFPMPVASKLSLLEGEAVSALGAVDTFETFPNKDSSHLSVPTFESEPASVNFSALSGDDNFNDDVDNDDNNSNNGAFRGMSTLGLVNMNNFDGSTIASASLQAPQPQPTKAKIAKPAKEANHVHGYPLPTINDYHGDVDDTIMELENEIMTNMNRSLDEVILDGHSDNDTSIVPDGAQGFNVLSLNPYAFPDHIDGQEEEPSSVFSLEEFQKHHLDVVDSASNRPKSTTSSKNDRTGIATNETKRVHIVRSTVFIALLLSTLFISAAIYTATSSAETRRFLDDYDSHASTVLISFSRQMRGSISALDNFGLTIQSFASVSGDGWPFVSIPDWPARAASAVSAANAAMLSVLPIVRDGQRQVWEDFALDRRKNSWIREAEEYAHIHGFNGGDGSKRNLDQADPEGSSRSRNHVRFPQGFPSVIYRSNESTILAQDTNDIYAPLWMHTPLNLVGVNFDTLAHPTLAREISRANETHRIILSRPVMLQRNEDDPLSVYACLNSTSPSVCDQPASFVSYPVLELDSRSQSSKRLAALVAQVFFWQDMLQAATLPPSAEGVFCVLTNQCEESFTFRASSSGTIEYIGPGNLHDEKFEYLHKSISMEQIFRGENGQGDILFSGLQIDKVLCPFTLSVYPSSQMEMRYHSNTPLWFTAAVVAVFSVTVVVFLAYDWVIERRQSVVLRTATKSSEILNTLYPEGFRERLFGDTAASHSNVNESGDGDVTWEDSFQARIGKRFPFGSDSKRRLNSFMNSAPSDENRTIGLGGSFSSAPIAELFPATTVMFADIAGFTAWSSIRDPSQVFNLLESTYSCFDDLASSRKVFKIETIGDCYLAVTGLPQPQEDHAIRICRFAGECIRSMQRLTRKLAVVLGPDTIDLSIRTGLHSGPVTAGVLRGQKARFQLFGDTVNTAARMESTGIPGRIQVSEATADHIVASGKGHWLTPREEIVNAKGKGAMKTYWVSSRRSLKTFHDSSYDAKSVVSIDDAMSVDMSVMLPPPPGNYEETTCDCTFKSPSNQDSSLHLQRLIDWNVELFVKLITNVIAFRLSEKQSKPPPNSIQSIVSQRSFSKLTKFISQENMGMASTGILSNPRSEYCEAISLLNFDLKHLLIEEQIDPESIELDEAVVEQLYALVTNIAHSYDASNPFHNFEHASHVVLSSNKMLGRIIAADDRIYDDNLTGGNGENFQSSPYRSDKDDAFQLHDFTLGIRSDGIAQLACAFSALTHDCDHPGVPNAQLVQENTRMAQLYHGKSVAEQNSIDLAWNLLMMPDYQDLRKCIFETEAEMKRFRQLLVNSVMATDIFDKELIALRNQRWNKAFDEDGSVQQNNDILKADLKATIVIEHIIQAADVAHTMQHWHIYQKWNRRLFKEMYLAFQNGRGKDPSSGWYDGELWFSDNYVIPLAKKLKECGVFGVTSDEALSYALANRREWEIKGREIVEDIVQEFNSDLHC